MAEKDIIQNMILQLGQSQDERMPAELGVHFADVDERTPEELLLFTKKFSELINYYRDNITLPAGNWANFFSYEQAIKPLLESSSASTTPHLALFLAFLELYKTPQEIINRFSGRHLDFYYQDVLRLQKKAAVADKAHVLLELKKNAAPALIGPGNLFSAGKDSTGVELIYAPTRETVIGPAVVESLRSLFVDKTEHATVRYAPIANSLDGVGGALNADEPKWYGFGQQALPPAEVGFAIASPVLRMQEGTRNVAVVLTLSNINPAKLNDSSLKAAFDVFISGAKNWLGPYNVSPTVSANNELKFAFTIPESETAVVDYDAAIHGYDYAAEAPVMQVLLRADSAAIGYDDFSNVLVQKALVTVDVSNITALSLDSDGGVLDPTKAFLPFGPQPAAGSRFLVGYPEALAKKLSEITLKVSWKDAPPDFSAHYSNYGVSGITNAYFTAAVSFKDGGSWENTSYGVTLFEAGNASAEHTFVFSPGTTSASPAITEGRKVYALNAAGSFWATNAASRYVLYKPVLTSFKTVIPEAREGFITFSLEKNFLHATYRKKYVENVLKYSKATSGDPIILNEPYTPAVQSISLTYKASSDDVNIASVSLDDFANADIQFFHIAYFGQMREHGYQRQQFSFLSNKNVSLLPVYDNEGELLIGLSKLTAGDSVSLLFQVAEGSADPDLEQERITWSVLCDNYWKPLGSSEVVLDTTNQLLASGIVQIIIPAEATTANTILPADRIWIKAALAQQVSAVCQLIDIAANAIEVKFTDNGNAPDHLSTALEKGKIFKLKNGLSAVKSVKHPYASFGGKPVESDDAFYTRSAERLRHKTRCITAWDYERIVLEAFPRVHKVKCIPHAREGAWLAPGNILIVVIPDLKNKNAMDPLQPKVDADTISRITAYVRERAGMQVKVKVKNPDYQKIQLDFKVKFHAGFEFNYYSEALKQALIEFLSPWAYGMDRPLSFGGRVYKSVLLDFVEDVNYVDYVTDFKMYSYIGETNTYVDLNVAQAETPDAILVSDKTHLINEAD